jgi:DNA-binding CsgD family transcriptional regulator
MSIDAAQMVGAAPGKSLPRWAGVYAARVIAARGDRVALARIFDRSFVPMVVTDDQRRFIGVNRPARLAFRLSLGTLRQMTINDMTPPQWRGVMDAAWARLQETGFVAGPYEVASPDVSRWEIFALGEVLPGRHLIMFAPSGFPEGELLDREEPHKSSHRSRLTRRELEVLQLAADGHNAPAIAHKLFLSPVTVNTHFGNIYAKLRVRDRAAAVASGMRLGLIH